MLRQIRTQSSARADDGCSRASAYPLGRTGIRQGVSRARAGRQPHREGRQIVGRPSRADFHRPKIRQRPFPRRPPLTTQRRTKGRCPRPRTPQLGRLQSRPTAKSLVERVTSDDRQAAGGQSQGRPLRRSRHTSGEAGSTRISLRPRRRVQVRESQGARP